VRELPLELNGLVKPVPKPDEAITPGPEAFLGLKRACVTSMLTSSNGLSPVISL